MGKRMRGAFFHLVVLSLVPALAGCSGEVDRAAGTQEDWTKGGEVVFDLSKGESLAALIHRGREEHGVISFQAENDFPVRLKFPDGSHLRELAGFVSVVLGDDGVKGGKYKAIEITSSGGTLSEKCNLARKLIADWALPEKGLGKWEAEAGGSEVDVPYKYSTGRTEDGLDRYIEFMRTHDPAAPWVLLIHLSWVTSE